MYALYQARGPLLGVGETIYQAVDDAKDRWPVDGHLLSESGDILTFDQYTDYTMMLAPGLEVPGELYVRRCTLALFEAVHAHAGPPAVDWEVNAQGRAQHI